MVCIWHSKVPGSFGTSIYHHIIDEGNELLKAWFRRELKGQDKAKRNKSCLRIVNLKSFESSDASSIPQFFIPQKCRNLYSNARSNKLKEMSDSEMTISTEIPQLNGSLA
eukprot:TRINITY_DN10902_c0_g3_i1.p1 TRINITY_DN10902_c0_g3~~TRINITY_DN10902_c0_g3_i1.p1  ORF type:complete len:110 (+),score=13.49 TRINITY_DN10902_c0_g3_i1:443-772(+)